MDFDAKVDNKKEKSSDELQRLKKERMSTAVMNGAWAGGIVVFAVFIKGIFSDYTVELLRALSFFPFFYFGIKSGAYYNAAKDLTEELNRRLSHLESGGDKYWDEPDDEGE